MREILISIKDIAKTYQTNHEVVRALQGITLDVRRGESIAFMGESGSGKSTLLSIIGGLNQPNRGSVEIDGIDIYALNQEKRADFRRKYLGFVFQQFQLIPYLTTLENVLLPLATTRYPARVKRDMAERVLGRVGLLSEKNRLPSQISGGEQERVAIARAIVNQPPLILADEPTGSLDSKTGQEIMALFADLKKDGLTILMVTHNPENAHYMDRLVQMRDGEISSPQR